MNYMENTTKTPAASIPALVNAVFRRMRKNTGEYVIFTLEKGKGINRILTNLHPEKAYYEQLQKGEYFLTPETGLWSNAPVTNDSQRSLHQYALNLFAAKRELIDSLYVKDLSRSPLVYSIVLREDTFANRDTVYDVLSDLQDAYDVDDVHFSFYPPSLKETLHDQTKIEL